MKPARLFSLLGLAALLSASADTWAQSEVYYPPPGEWEHKKPEEVGMDSRLLATAIEYAKSQEASKPMDFSDQEEIFGKLLGPIPTLRAHTNGLVIRRGYIVAKFGDTTKVARPTAPLRATCRRSPDSPWIAASSPTSTIR